MRRVRRNVTSTSHESSLSDYSYSSTQHPHSPSGSSTASPHSRDPCPGSSRNPANRSSLASASRAPAPPTSDLLLPTTLPRPSPLEPHLSSSLKIRRFARRFLETRLRSVNAKCGNQSALIPRGGSRARSGDAWVSTVNTPSPARPLAPTRLRLRQSLG